jgi:hypothetical protein
MTITSRLKRRATTFVGGPMPDFARKINHYRRDS